MRSMEEQMQEILRRKAYYTARRQLQRMTFLAGGLGLMLIAALLFAPGITGSPVQAAGSVLGATILGPEAGGYVIVALIACALGIVAVLLTHRDRQMKEREEKKEV